MLMFHLISNYNDEQKSFVWAVGDGWAGAINDSFFIVE